MQKNDAISALCVAFIKPIVEEFLRQYPDWSATRLGRVSLKDPGKVGMLRRGTQLRPGTAKKLLKTIDKAAPGFAENFVKEMSLNA